MNKKEIANEVAIMLDIRKNDVIIVMNKIFETIVNNINEKNEISISKFGKFKVKKQNEKIGRNPKTGETIKVNEGYKIFFKPSIIMKDYLNNKLLKEEKK